MKAVIFLVLLMSSAFAETNATQEREFPYKDSAQAAQISEEAAALTREPYEWNGPFTQTDHRLYVTTVGYKGGYNMGPYSKNGIMKGMPIPAHGSAFKWGPCDRSMLSPTFVNGWIRTPGGKYRNPAYMVRPGGVACAKL